MLRLVLTLAMTLSFLAAPLAFAEEEDDFIPGEFSGNATWVSDYVFRGVSQTVEESPAFQGGFDWSHDSGIYVGTWASSVDFGSDTYLEHDVYAGFGTALGDFNVDASAIYFIYPEESDLNYWEFAFAADTMVGDIGVNAGLIISPDYLNAFGTGVIINAGASYEIPVDLPIGISVDGLIEYTKTEDDGILGTDDDYVDWNVGTTFSYNIVSVDLRYHGTDEASDVDAADHRFVGSIGVAFP